VSGEPVGSQGPPRLSTLGVRLPRVALAELPTPVERLGGLSDELSREVWVKRDDQTGRLYGGNKVRKLELLLGDALARGLDRVVTFGAYGSHHCLATATYGAQVGLKVCLALYPQPVTDHVLDDLLLSHGTGAELVAVNKEGWLSAATQLMIRLARPGEVIPPGGSSPLGTLGYVEAALELVAQVEAGELPRPERIFLPAGTCGTAAGLLLGFQLAGLKTTLVLVRVVTPALGNLTTVRTLRDLALRRLRSAGLSDALAAQAEAAAEQGAVTLDLDPDEFGPGYGHATPAGEAALARLAAEGVALETTYTAKTAASLLRRAGEGEGPILFWNTFSSVDVSERLAAVDPATLPEAFHPALREGGRL
jgi:D-cysteine desulfhydrase